MKNNRIYVDNKELVLVLDNGYSPVNICSINKAQKLICKDRAEVVVEDDEPMFTSDRAYQRPTIIRLYNPINFFHKRISVTRNHVFKRDGHKCSYCNSSKELTVDHVVPKSRGGGYTWENLVTCCKRCNSKKDDRTPDEAGMNLMSKPFRPSFVMFIKNYNGHLRKGWETYLKETKVKEKPLY